MSKKRVSRAKLAFVMVACAAGAACSSTNKDSNERFSGRRQDDGARPRLDLANYVYNTLDAEPRGLTDEERKPDLAYLTEDEKASLNDPEKAKLIRKAWQNFKRHPRNYKYSCAVAPLYNEIRRAGQDDLGAGDAPENISDTLLSRPINDDESRERAAVPADDKLGGVPLVNPADRAAKTEAPAGPAKTDAPKSEAPSKEAPASEPVKEPAKSEPAKTEPPKEEPKAEPAKTEPPKEEPKAEPAKVEPPKEEPKAEPPKAEPPKEDPKAEPPKVEMKEAPEPKAEPPKKSRRVGEAPRPATTQQYAATEPSGTGTPGSDVAVISTDSAAAERVRRLQRIASLEGMNFAIEPNGFRDRMASVLDEFRVFEKVDKVNFTNDQKTLESLFQQAEDNKDDFLLVCRLKRNKVSFIGIEPGGWFGDGALWFLFIVPFEFWGWIPREQYEGDVELAVTLYDVRSRAALIDQTFEGRDLLVLSTGQRGYQVLGNLLIAFPGWYRHEALFSNSGDWVRPGAWLDMERQLLDHVQNQFKRELDKESYPTLEDRTNPEDGKIPSFTELTARASTRSDSFSSKEHGLIVGIAKYDEKKAAPKLAQWAVEAMRTGDVQLSMDEARAQLIAAYNDNTVELGTRPYAENDAKQMADLLRRRGALGNRDGISPANLQVLTGKGADAVSIRGAFRQIAKARREDKVFVYLNGETLVIDDATAAEETSKYFLPYDIDLERVDALRNDRAGLKAFLDENAVSFDWIEDCLNRSGSTDHVYLQSRHAMLIVDCTFPGTFTGTRFCPERVRKTAGKVRTPVGYGEGIGRVASDTPGGPGGDKKPADDKKTAPPPEDKKPEDKKPEDKKPEDKKPEDKKPEDVKKGKRVGAVFPAPQRVKTTTVLAGDAAPVTTADVALATQIVTTNFAERLVQGSQGRIVVLTTSPEEVSLDIPDAHQGGFVYYFTQFLDAAKQARFATLRRADGAYEAAKLLGYATDRVEAESRQTGRPQHVTVLGQVDRPFVVVSGTR